MQVPEHRDSPLLFGETILAVGVAAFAIRAQAALKIGAFEDEFYYTFTGLAFWRNILKSNFSYKAWSFCYHPPFMMLLHSCSYLFYVLLASLRKYGLRLNLEILEKESILLAKGRAALFAMRVPSILMGTLSCILLYMFSIEIFGNEMVALISASLLAVLPHFVAQTSMAELDGGLTFLVLASAFALYNAISFGSLQWVLLAGVFLGLTLGSKATGFVAMAFTLPWFLLEVFQSGLYCSSCLLPYVAFWIIGALVFYVSWPLIWKHPIKETLVRFRGIATFDRHDKYPVQVFYLGRNVPRADFYLVHLLVMTPLTILSTAIAGAAVSILTVPPSSSQAFVALWIVVPLTLLSLPVSRPRDIPIRNLTFIYPPLVMMSSLGIERLGRILSGFISVATARSETVVFLLWIVVLASILIEDWLIHPYYLDYFNQLVGSFKGASNKFLTEDGQGIDDVVAWIESRANQGALIWTYAPKGPVIYHSDRIDLRRSLGDEGKFFPNVTSPDVDYEVDRIAYQLRKGDLQYYFPRDAVQHDVAADTIRRSGASFIILSRKFTQGTALDEGSQRFVVWLRESCVPAHTACVRGVEMCYVYEVSRLP